MSITAPMALTMMTAMNSPMNEPKQMFTVVTEMYSGEETVAWVDEGCVACTWPTRREAQGEIEGMAREYREQVAAGERDPTFGDSSEDDRVVECLVHDNGDIEIPELGVRWTMADVREQRGEEEDE